ncbi:bifunctional hydroxymethylpyrimidine kinase/phosphomethylpyrimidine kinase [Gordonia sp. (in: high G+C Gram-positive bacteria)]|uniref:bifunctional hydroxymethylpyrimidine kinase/phosphomethylpyrimidine kinase n=1 Tax=Gordonia sp. (in: high G+C Gram-positive bacteria) TaxID=84139 RepID=UPI0026179D25|nr:bifunctional hydroxymethylpyrimidine kinase/phosphomethylpyrimidine kinase [Gordonia sp. (in: high G+C Gram-positive bacteria)]
MTPAPLPLPPPGTTPVRVLTVAGSDSGGGAGIEADLRTFALAGVHGCVALTAVTVQNSLGVTGVQEVVPEIVAAQIASVTADIGVGAVKTGMLASSPIIAAVAEAFDTAGIGGAGPIPLVVDPVCASMHGDPLLADDARATLVELLFPRATLVTPNLDEVRILTGIDVVDDASQQAAARELHRLGARWALVKGGHLRGSDRSPDLLFDGARFSLLDAPRVPTAHDHGAGDTLAAATAAALAHGRSVPEAVAFGKDWVTQCLRAAYPLGAGHGPVSPLGRLWAATPR